MARGLPQPVEGSRPREAGMTEETGTTSDVVAGMRLTHPERVLFPVQGITKRDLALYLEAAAPRLLPHAAGRLLSLVRCPRGRSRQCFFQRHGGASLPSAFRRLQVQEKEGGSDQYVYLDDIRGLIAAAQFGVLELHVWGSRVDALDTPDRIVFDIDPDPAVPFAAVRDAARRMRDALDALGLAGFALVTGGKGIHVVVPIIRRHGWPTVAGFARAVAERFAADAPDRFVATMSKAERQGRIFIDHFRNGRAATAICPYSPRAREGAPVAWPVAWDALDGVPGADAFRLPDVRARLADPDPWEGYATLRQELTAAALRALGL
ncbi:MAG: non-homologous end-joining DNA ligase [Alphaproteobacteria bacterium]|nr:non-homologous end-joining DNA ligase [Alphaproteobacteria bacterium]